MYKQETIEDILREMRRLAASSATICWADRIEAAWKRQKVAIEADAHVRIAASETRIHELEQRLAEVEAFADFARPLWPDATTTTTKETTLTKN